jgi:IS30 family transposase
MYTIATCCARTISEKREEAQTLNTEAENTQPSGPIHNPLASAAPPTTGRPRALDETKQAEVCALISTGCGLEWVARYVGCAASTIRREASRNPKFRQRLRQATMDAEVEPLQAVRRAANTHWRAGVWYLKQLHAQRAATQEIRFEKSRRLENFAREVYSMLMSTIGDVDVLNNVLHRFEDLRHNVNRRPPASKHVAFPVDVPPEKKYRR